MNGLLRWSKSLASLLLVSVSIVSAETNWPQFRGPGSKGVATGDGLPDRWSATENVVWKSDLPGRGWSSDRLGQSRRTDDGCELGNVRRSEERALFWRQSPDSTGFRPSMESNVPRSEDRSYHLGAPGTRRPATKRNSPEEQLRFGNPARPSHLILRQYCKGLV